MDDPLEVPFRADLTNCSYPQGQREIASSWLSTAKIARKAGQFEEAYAAILRANQLDVQMGRLEQARWWWHQGQSRKAIESLQNSFAANIFDFNRDTASAESSNLSLNDVATNAHNFILGKAMALLTRWLDIAKQTSEEDLLNRYKKVQALCEKWEKSHYLLGHYYNRLLEHEESKPPARQKDSYLQGELTKLVCHSYLTSLRHGNKYLYETLPRVLTLWLDFGANYNVLGVSREEKSRLIPLRLQRLVYMSDQMEKALKRLPVYLVPLFQE
jgi:serine/threonine-protein kinase ATR